MVVEFEEKEIKAQVEYIILENSHHLPLLKDLISDNTTLEFDVLSREIENAVKQKLLEWSRIYFHTPQQNNNKPNNNNDDEDDLIEKAKSIPKLLTSRLNNIKHQNQKIQFLLTSIITKYASYLKLISKTIKTSNKFESIVKDSAYKYHSTFQSYFCSLVENSRLKLMIIRYELMLQVYSTENDEQGIDLSSPKRIRQILHQQLQQSETKQNELGLELEAYQGVGQEFNSILESYTRVLKGIDVLSRDIDLLNAD